MKILIICDAFPPAFAPRMGYLCKYLKMAGWESVVLTEFHSKKMFSFLTGYAQVKYINFYHVENKLITKLKWMFIFLMDILFHFKDKKMVKEGTALLKEGGYSAILCSTYRTFPLPAAGILAKKFSLPFIADLRDIIEQFSSTEYISHFVRTFGWLDNKLITFYRNKLLFERNKVLREANCLVTVSPWHTHTLSAYNSNVKLIYNGYDPEIFYPRIIKAPCFYITYTGKLLSFSLRDPSLLLEAIERLDAAGKINPQEVKLRWFVDENSEKQLKAVLKQFPVGEYTEFCEYVSADKIPEILSESSILLQLANKAEGNGPKGIMTTKLFESLAMEKPLLCVRSDESYLEETIRKTNSGLAARCVEEVEEFILYYFEQWKTQGYTHIKVNREELKEFSRKHQAEQFMEIIKELSD